MRHLWPLVAVWITIWSGFFFSISFPLPPIYCTWQACASGLLYDWNYSELKTRPQDATLNLITNQSHSSFCHTDCEIGYLFGQLILLRCMAPTDCSSQLIFSLSAKTVAIMGGLCCSGSYTGIHFTTRCYPVSILVGWQGAIAWQIIKLQLWLGTQASGPCD